MKIILGFSFGHRGNEPGLSNEAIAQAIREFDFDRSCVQWEIFLAMKKTSTVANQVIWEHHEPFKYLDTREVARQMAQYLHKNNFHKEEILVFAHPDHLPRCMSELKKLNISVVPIKAKIPYDPESYQIHTRCRLFYTVWEYIALLYRLFYKY
ncbi:MAG: hypothetical protein G01um101418_763 [Parcubacteria group bacterium Gr01-1014_18]|nr:MAG: hypothetical protein Greene041636_767 [Parcubacteria group bacterium Greene0416_36]TSC80128.1 MAG: hypothetical protein G01um101418_763 [Parcubacteria group bacterium Gr01-1014_18]TSC99342.1 MAG: hypothetical protein Greene101420_270 [Parcubacteria group bacterium Greene1014_20]TSD06821.1 MAG: hypothetical protein Greene07142_555 [Parcubacteria group bacterium Greene0714_2]